MHKTAAAVILSIFVMLSPACKNDAADNLAQQEKKAPSTKIDSSDAEHTGKQNNITSDLDTLIEKGNKAFEEKNLDEAINLYTKALSLNPDYAQLHYSIGLAYGHKGQFDDAILAFQKAIAIEPNHIKARNNLGLAYERKGLLDQAYSEYKQAIQINPDDAQTHYNIARVYSVKKGRDPELGSLAADHYFRAGVLFLEQGDEIWAIMAYNGLKQIKATEREQELYNKFTPELQKKVSSK